MKGKMKANLGRLTNKKQDCLYPNTYYLSGAGQVTYFLCDSFLSSIKWV